MDYLDPNSNDDFDFFQEKNSPKTRPGKKPAIADEFLTVAELDQRNTRRKRNKESAKKIRDRKKNYLKELNLKTKTLQDENKKIKLEIDELKNALAIAKNKVTGLQNETRLEQFENSIEIQFRNEINQTDLHGNQNLEFTEFGSTEDYWISEMNTEQLQEQINNVFEDDFNAFYKNEAAFDANEMPAYNNFSAQKTRNPSSISHINLILVDLYN